MERTCVRVKTLLSVVGSHDCFPGAGDVNLRGSDPSTAIQPESGAVTSFVGSFVKQRGQRKIRPRGSSPRFEAR